MAIFGFICFILSAMGYRAILHDYGVSKYLSWLTAFWLEILIVYLFALGNQMDLGMWLAVGLGLALLAWHVLGALSGKRRLMTLDIHVFDVWMLIFGGIMLCLVGASYFAMYDNFDHWAMVPKFYHFEGRLQVASDAIIQYGTTPPSVSLFIATFLKWVGFSEGAMLIAQFMYCWAAVYTVFALLRDRTRVMLSGILCLAIAISLVLNHSVRFNNLLVDYLLAVLVVAGSVGIYVYRKKATLQWLHVVLTIMMVSMLKNIGIFFALILLVDYAYIRISDYHDQHLGEHRWWRNLGEEIMRTVTAAIVGFLPIISWSVYLQQVYKFNGNLPLMHGYESRLQLTQGDYAGMVIQQIWENMTWLPIMGVVLMNVVLLLVWAVLHFRFRQKNTLAWIVMLLDILTVAYLALILYMYIAVFPYSEVKGLWSLERLLSTIAIIDVLLGAGALVVALDRSFYESVVERRTIRSFRSHEGKWAYQSTSFFVFLMAWLIMNGELGQMFEARYAVDHDSLGSAMSQYSKERTTLTDERILVVDTKNPEYDTSYATFLGRYYYYGADVTGQEMFKMNQSEFVRTLADYDYVSIPRGNDDYTRQMKRAYGEAVPPGLYEVTNHGLEPVDQIK